MPDPTPDLRQLLAAISPLPYWIEPARPPRDAYIACGTRGDAAATYDVIERYNVDTDYAYLVAAANAVPELLDRLDEAERRASRTEEDLALLNRMYDRIHDEYAALKEAADLTERVERLGRAVAALQTQADAALEPATGREEQGT